MRLIVNIKKIEMDTVYEYITLKYKGYRHGRKVWFDKRAFSTWFKYIRHGLTFGQGYKQYKSFNYYKNKCIYRDYDNYIYLCGIEYELKK